MGRPSPHPCEQCIVAACASRYGEFLRYRRDGERASGHIGQTAGGEATMSSFVSREKLIATIIFVGAMAAAPIAPAVAQQEVPPDFSSNNVGWVGLNGGGPFFEPVPGRLPPVTQDPAHPFVPNGV